MIKIRLEGTYTECLAAAAKIKSTAGMRVHVQSKFYVNRGETERGRIYLDVEILN